MTRLLNQRLRLVVPLLGRSWPGSLDRGSEDAVGAGATLTHDVTLEERQRLLYLEEIPVAKAASTAGADPRLGPHDGDGLDVIADVAVLPAEALTRLLACRVGDVVTPLAAARSRDGVAASAVRRGNLLEALFGEGEGPEFAGVGTGGGVRYPCGVHRYLLLGRVPGSSHSCGAIFIQQLDCLILRLQMQ